MLMKRNRRTTLHATDRRSIKERTTVFNSDTYLGQWRTKTQTTTTTPRLFTKYYFNFLTTSSKTTAVRHRELAHAGEEQKFVLALIFFLLLASYLICLKRWQRKCDGEGNTHEIGIPMQRRRTLFDTPRCSLSRLEPRTTENNNSNVERTTTSAQQQTSDLPPAYDSVVEENKAIIIIQQQSLLPPTYETFMQRNNEREETYS
ncbi:unnamed protein product [Adineta steineri]|uniref:Uncharacterized protein n=1 Tax=Adineta steineri TaxID=433720 RepID=A0A819TN43_9BILA|nr:unnamed protein product [Adineta steineri]